MASDIPEPRRKQSFPKVEIISNRTREKYWTQNRLLTSHQSINSGENHSGPCDVEDMRVDFMTSAFYFQF